MTTKKLELRIDLGDSVIQTPTPSSAKQRKSGESLVRLGSNRGRTSRAESSTRASVKSPYHSALGPSGSNISGVSIVNASDGRDQSQRDGRNSVSRLLRSRGHNKPETAYSAPKVEPLLTTRNETFTPFNSTKDFEISKRPIFTPANTAITLVTPLRGTADSPLKPYKRQFATAVPRGRQLVRSTIHEVPATAPTMGKRDQQAKRVRMKDKKGSRRANDSKIVESPSGTSALRELFDAIGKETAHLTFKQMLEVKVAVGMASHIPRELIEDMTNLQSVLDELSLLWKINRMDIDLLEYLLHKIGLYEEFSSDIAKYKTAVDYSIMTGSSERDVTTIIATLHNLLQGSEDATGAYTTISFSHHGDVYSFMRERLSCMKKDLSRWLGIHYTQITYVAKLTSNGDGYVTVMQIPSSTTKKIVHGARKNHPVLMSLGVKGVQITGSDGLKYTQSMGYLQEKEHRKSQNQEPELRDARSARTAPAGPSLPPLTQKQKEQQRLPHTSMAQHSEIKTPRSQRRNQSQMRQSDEPAILEEEEEEEPILFPKFEPPTVPKDESLLPQTDPDEAKFERRVRLARETLTKLTKPENEELVGVLLDQIQKLQRLIVTLKKDLREKTRDLNSSQSYVHRAQKEMKSMEMRVESKAQEISQTNDHLLQRVKRLMRENARLRELVEGKDAELEMHRQANKENRLTGMMKIARVSRVPKLPQPIPFG